MLNALNQPVLITHIEWDLCFKKEREFLSFHSAKVPKATPYCKVCSSSIAESEYYLFTY